MKSIIALLAVAATLTACGDDNAKPVETRKPCIAGRPEQTVKVVGGKYFASGQFFLNVNGLDGNAVLCETSPLASMLEPGQTITLAYLNRLER